MNWQFSFPAKNLGRWKILYAGSYDDYQFVDQLFQEAIMAVGGSNMQRVFDYIAPRLKEKGLDPKKWISWVFRKRMI